MIYAVNRQTKEHRVVDEVEAEYLSQLDRRPENGIIIKRPSKWRIIKADEDGWIEWRGSVQPLPDRHPVEVKTDDGLRLTGEADHYYWGEDHPFMSRVTAYRPILASRPQAPEWDGEGFPTSGARCEAYVLAETNKNGDWRSGYAGFKAQASNGGAGMTFADDNGDKHFIEAVTHFRPIRTDRELWVEAAKEHFCDDDSTATMEFIYDALKSGELPQP